MSFSINQALQTLQKHPSQYSSTINIFKSLSKPNQRSNTPNPDDYYILGQNALYLVQTFPDLYAQLREAKQGEKFQANDWVESSVPFLKLREQSLKFYLRVVLLEKQQRVALWEKNASQKEFKKTKEASPGNILPFESILLSEDDTDDADAIENSVGSMTTGTATGSSSLVSIIVGICLKVDSKKEGYSVGLTSVDTLNRVIYLAQFNDNLELSHLESVLIQVSAKECVYVKPRSDVMHEKLKEILQRSEIYFTQSDTTFRKTEFDNDLNTLLVESYRMDARVNDQLQREEQAQEAANCVLNYLGLPADPENRETFKLKPFDVHTFMRLDSSAMKSLNVMTSELGKRLSLYGLLDSCKTRMGSRKLESWVRQPLRLREEILERQAVIECFVDDPNMLQTVRSDLRYIKDMSTILRRLKAKKSSLKDLYYLYETVKKLPSLVEHIESDSPLTSPQNYDVLNRNFIIPFRTILSTLEQYKAMIMASVDLELAEDEHEYLLRPEVDEALTECHHAKEEAFEKMEKVGQKLCNKTNIELRIVNVDKNRYRYFCLQTTKKNLKQVKAQKGYHELENRKTGIFFTYRDFEPHAQEYETRRLEYEVTQKNLVEALVDVAFTYANMLDQAKELIAELDVLASLAHVAVSNNYVKPEILDGSENVLELVESRHPMVESEKEFIKNDVHIGRDESRFLVVTGCNMGGKSTYCRQIAIIVLMAQIGSFVPCTSARVAIRDAILCRIGANDALLIGISTFMAEMIETSSILHNATDQSLVVVDELGRGTSSYDGYALAYAISEYLINRVGCMTLFATHFHELSQLEKVYQKKITNLHVQTTQSNDNLHMLYKIARGCSKESFGIEVSRLAKFPQSIVDTAENKVKQLKERKRKRDEETGDMGSNKKRRMEQIENFLKEFSMLEAVRLNGEGVSALCNHLGV